MAFQINGNTIIDSSGSLIVNANTSIANNFSVQLTPFASRESTSPMQGTVAGFASGGDDTSSPPVHSNVVDKFLFSNELTATDVGDLAVARLGLTGHSSDTDGFVSGGLEAPTPSSLGLNTIEKFSFSSFVTASDHGDLSRATQRAAGHSSTTHGFTSGGSTTDPSPPPANLAQSDIDKFSFATNTTATDVGDLSVARESIHSGFSSEDNGFTGGGYAGSPTKADVNTIDKFPFAISAGTATDIGDLTEVRRTVTAVSSPTHGYACGGESPKTNTIDKFPFATSTNASDVGDLLVANHEASPQSSRESGYVSGGNEPPAVARIQRFPFATDTNASDVGSLTVARRTLAGQQD